MTRRTRLQARTQALCESDGSDLTDVEDLEAAVGAVHDGDSAVFDDSGVHDSLELDSTDEYFASGYKRSKAAKKPKKEDHDGEAYGEGNEGSVKKRKRAKKLVWTLDAPFNHLSDEVTAIIFSHLGVEKKGYGPRKHFRTIISFIQVSKRFLKIAATAEARSLWLFQTYGKESALYEAVKLGWICDGKTIDYLIDVLGARASRYFFQIITLAYIKRAPTWVGQSLCTPDTIPFACWLALLKKACAMYPGISPTQRKTDSDILSAWVDSQGTTASFPKKRKIRRRVYMAEGYYAMKSIAKPSTVVSFDDDEQAELVRQQEFKTIRSLFIDYKFAPFSDRDPVNMRAYAQALIINPEFSDLAVEAGFEVPNDFGETIYQTVSTREDWTAEDKINELTGMAQELFSLHPDLKPDAEYFSRRLLPSIDDLDQIELLALLDADDDRIFDFSIADAIPDFMQHRLESVAYESSELKFGAYQLLRQFPPKNLPANLRVTCAKICLNAANQSKPFGRQVKEDSQGRRKPSVDSIALSDVITFMRSLQFELSFADLLEIVLTVNVNEERWLVLLQYLKQTVEDWQEVVFVAAGSLLWSPSNGPQLRRLLKSVPAAKSYLKQTLLSDFHFDGDKLAEHGYSGWGYSSWLSPFSQISQPYGYAYPHRFSHDIYLSNDSSDYRLCRKDMDPSPKSPIYYRYSLGYLINEIFADDKEIQQHIILSGVLKNHDGVLSSAIADNSLAISLELFELLAAVNIAPPDALFEMTIKAPFVRSHAKAVELLEPGNPEIRYSEVQHLQSWVHGFERVLMKKVEYLEARPTHWYRPIQSPTDNPFVVTLVEWKQAFEDAAASLAKSTKRFASKR